MTAAAMAGVTTGDSNNLYKYTQNIGTAASLAANSIAKRNALGFRNYYGRPYGCGYRRRGIRGRLCRRRK